jgi:hypothetical protein
MQNATECILNVNAFCCQQIAVCDSKDFSQQKTLAALLLPTSNSCMERVPIEMGTRSALGIR